LPILQKDGLDIFPPPESHDVFKNRKPFSRRWTDEDYEFKLRKTPDPRMERTIWYEEKSQTTVFIDVPARIQPISLI
jgi:hypothetical protein